MNNWISKCLIGITCFCVTISMQSAWSQTETLFKTAAKTPAQHLAEHMLDKRACIDGFKAIRQDASFLNLLREQINAGGSDESELPFQSLNDSKYSKNPAIQRLVKNKTRFVLGSYFHHMEMTASIQEVYCSTKTFDRMEKVEHMGESMQAWTLRQEVLDSDLRMINYPFNCAGYGVDFSSLYKEAVIAQTIYRKNQKLNYENWIKNAALKIKEKLAQTETCGMTLEDQRKEITSWANQLEALIK